MIAFPRLQPVLGLVVAFGLVLGSAAAPRAVVAEETASTLSAWRGGVDLYREGTFTTQKSWLWCTAAGVQIVRNIVEGKADHSTGGQRRYFEWMRERNRYDLPESAGVDPAGWTAGLRQFVDDRYRLVSSRTFDGALRSAVERLRRTNLPVALAVSHGNHGWILAGFEATADPAATSKFRVTSVRVVGPLHGLQSKNGYDMPPNTELTPARLKRFFTPWKYDPKPMVWDGRYVSIQPIPDEAAVSAATPAPTAATLPLIALLGREPTPGPVAVAVVSGPPTTPEAIDADTHATSSALEAVASGGSTTGSGPPILIMPIVLLGLALILGSRVVLVRARSGRNTRGSTSR